jgi:hypothetical protein
LYFFECDEIADGEESGGIGDPLMNIQIIWWVKIVFRLNISCNDSDEGADDCYD